MNGTITVVDEKELTHLQKVIVTTLAERRASLQRIMAETVEKMKALNASEVDLAGTFAREQGITVDSDADVTYRFRAERGTIVVQAVTTAAPPEE